MLSDGCFTTQLHPRAKQTHSQNPPLGNKRKKERRKKESKRDKERETKRETKTETKKQRKTKRERGVKISG